MENLIIILVVLGVAALSFRERQRIFRWLRLPGAALNDGFLSSLESRKTTLRRRCEDAGDELKYLEDTETGE